jgi:hypothetical protein
LTIAQELHKKALAGNNVGGLKTGAAVYPQPLILVSKLLKQPNVQFSRGQKIVKIT